MQHSRTLAALLVTSAALLASCSSNSNGDGTERDADHSQQHSRKPADNEQDAQDANTAADADASDQADQPEKPIQPEPTIMTKPVPDRESPLMIKLREAHRPWYSGNPAASKEAFAALEQEAAQAGEVSVQMEAIALQARMITLMPDRDLEAAKQMLDRALQVGDNTYPLGWAQYLCVRGIIERELNQKDTAFATFKEMASYCESQELHSKHVDAVHHIALVLPLEEQIPYALAGIKAAEKGGDQTKGWLGPLWNNLGNTYHDLGRYQEALDAFLNAEKYHDLSGNEMRMMMADWAVGRAYAMVGEHDRGEKILLETYDWADRLRAQDQGNQAREFMGMCLHELGVINGLRGLKEKALQQLNEARAIYVEVGYPDHWPEGMQKIDMEILALKQNQ